MGAKHFGRALLVAFLCPGAAFALGLGDIKLNSALNAPLDADIELLGAAPDELASLKAQLASRETFTKYGLDYPGFLSTVTLAKGKSAGGRDVLKVTSQETITEPFVTLLVDVNWGRGRLVREYTVLLDPPVFTPGNATPAPVVPANTGSPRSGSIERPAPPPSTTPSSEPSDDSYTVRRGDTLSGVARGLSGSYSGSTAQQIMLAIYRNNPGSFEGSMNSLRNGSILRLPAPTALAGISASEAAAAVSEAGRQYSAWRGRGDAGSQGPGRLRLVAPNEPGTSSGSGASAGGATAADVKGLRDKLTQVETELAESRRMLELKNAELADLQRRLAASGGATAPTPKPEPSAGVPAKPPAAAEPSSQPGTPPAQANVPPPVTNPAAQANEPVASATEPAPPVTPAPAPKAEAPKPKPRVIEEPPTAEPSFFSSLIDSVTSIVKDYWYLAAGLLVALLAFLGLRKFRGSRTSGDEFAVARYDANEPTLGGGDALSAAVSRASDTGKLRRPTGLTNADERGIHVEESGEIEQPKFASGAALRSEDTLSGETGINLDQSDPLAEADFHMAYGLYDQAADLVRTAILREPNRRDLKLKLVEVFFVWGNRDEFLNTARDLYQTRSAAAPGEWDKILIMGRQIAPEDPLFSGTAGSAGPTEAVDLDLHPGESKLDFDLLGDGSATSGPAADNNLASTVSMSNTASITANMGAAALAGATATLGSSNGLDLDFSATGSGLHAPIVDPDLADPDSNAQTSDKLEAGDTAEFNAAFASADRSGATTREMVPQFAPSLPDLNEMSADLGEAPTVEQPQLRTNSPTIRQKIDAVLRQANNANDQTAEVAIDDLGLDLGAGLDLDAHDLTGDTVQTPLEIPADAPADAPTLVAGLDAESRQLINAAANASGADASANTGEWFTGTKTERDTSATASMAALDVDLSEHGDTSSTAQLQRPKNLDIDLEKLAHNDLDNTATSAILPSSPDELSLPALEPMTISEVGTKLDLARAYMDMGDPDGARSILKEVLQEGSVSQKQEAQRLIDSLPG